ncbi:HAMP domain-containing sensor histidine kinase [Methylobacterium sp.]|uniref:sensor histidine kinase n=1 Tax=Methylobacterium sp. TaxID=409 RepID=UPI0015CAA117|nr:HAMP domain-containing sensor histidine kinase [Methylobacterium sp.]
MSALYRLLPNSLGGQVMAILVMALLFSQGLALLLYLLLVPEGDTLQRPRNVAAKIATIARIADALPPEQRAKVASIASGRGLVATYSTSQPSLGPSAQQTPSSNVIRWIAEEIGINPNKITAEPSSIIDLKTHLRLAIPLAGGGWLDIDTNLGPFGRLGLLQQIAAVASLFLSIGCVSIWLARWVTLPLSRFASAAERLGTEGTAPLLSERGPIEVHRAAHTFNLMQHRLRRFLDAQTRMLAAISHDLRTPLTRIRLRLEMPPTSENQTKILQDLSRMEQMLGLTLSFLRDQQASEDTEAVDLASLLQALCDEFNDTGSSTNYSGVTHCSFWCRPQALERAFSNVIGNAAKFGTKVDVYLIESAKSIIIDVGDDGPGISEQEKVKVFEPFYRSDDTRNCSQAGAGLGLSIAQTVILGHGGEIKLLDRVPHGLIVRIILPNANKPVLKAEFTDR